MCPGVSVVNLYNQGTKTPSTCFSITFVSGHRSEAIRDVNVLCNVRLASVCPFSYRPNEFHRNDRCADLIITERENAGQMKAVSIKRGRSDELLIDWQDGHQSRYLLAELRDHCPCASCSGEQILFRTVEGAPQDRSAPGRNDLTGIRQVGSYAIQLEWKDGHSTGIYAWEYLRGLCPCDECSAARSGRQYGV